MASRVYLHIGAPKSGTTYVQTVLWSNQARLREAGVLLPGERRGDHSSAAVWGRSPEPSRGLQKVWGRLRAEMESWDGPAILSNEWFTRLPPELIARLVGELQPADLHVVFTARNLAATVPAAWQERLKLGDAVPFDAFLGTLDDHPHWNWANLDASVALTTWERYVSADHIHLVTVPPPGAPRDLLWRRFADACSFDPDVCDLDTAIANESLSAESARLLQLMGPQLRAAIDADTVGGYVPHTWIRHYVGHRLLAAQQGSRIALRPEDLAEVNERSRALVEGIQGRGYDVRGSLSDLLDGSIPDGAVRPEDVDDAALLQLALAVIPPMLGRLRREKETATRERARADRLAAEVAAMRRQLQEVDQLSGPQAAPRRGGTTRGADRPTTGNARAPVRRVVARFPARWRRRVPEYIRRRVREALR